MERASGHAAASIQILDAFGYRDQYEGAARTIVELASWAAVRDHTYTAGELDTHHMSSARPPP